MSHFFKRVLSLSVVSVFTVTLHAMDMRNILTQPMHYALSTIAYDDISSLEKALAIIPFSKLELTHLLYKAVLLKKEAIGHWLQTHYNLRISSNLLDAAQESGYRFFDTRVQNVCSGPLSQPTVYQRHPLFCNETFLEN